jgi:hypothetical protein
MRKDYNILFFIQLKNYVIYKLSIVEPLTNLIKRGARTVRLMLVVLAVVVCEKFNVLVLVI